MCTPGSPAASCGNKAAHQPGARQCSSLASAPSSASSTLSKGRKTLHGLLVCSFAAGVSVQQKRLSRLQQRLHEAALAGGRCTIHWFPVLSAGPAANAAHAACAFALGLAGARINREFALQRILQCTSHHRFLFLGGGAEYVGHLQI